MRKSMMLATAAAILGLTGAVIAHEDNAGWKSWEATHQQRITPEEMKSKLNDLGYYVRRLETEHDRFEAYLIERKSGGGVIATFNRQAGQLIKARLSTRPATNLVDELATKLPSKALSTAVVWVL